MLFLADNRYFDALYNVELYKAGYHVVKRS